MPYRIVKIGERVIFVPDKGLMDLLDCRKKILRRSVQKNSRISVFAMGNGLKILLSRHIQAKHRFFVIVDFVHAFHQITKEMVESVFPQIASGYYEMCFAKISECGDDIIPTGFPTSSILFEIFFSKTIDPALLVWAKEYDGVATRSGDNILITWKKNTPEAWQELKETFRNFQVRFTPQRPRKWQEPIRFCGIFLPKKGCPVISERRKKFLLNRARKRPKSLFVVKRFFEQWE